MNICISGGIHNEKYRDLWAEIADAYKKNTNEMLAIQLWGKDYEKIILQNRIQDINGFKDNYLRIQSQITDNEKEIKSLEEKKEIYQQLKDQWNSISSEYENQMNRQYAAQLLGANWEQDVLNGRLYVLNNFRNQYIAIQQAIADAAWQSAQAQIQAAQAAQSTQSGGSGGGGTSGGGTAPSPTPNQNVPVWVVKDNSTGNNLYTGTKAECNNYITHHNYSIVREDSSHHYIYVTPKGNTGGRPGGGNRDMNYATGTKSAKPGWHRVSESELGDEIIIDNDDTAMVARGEQLYNFEGGETVIPAKQSKKILENQGNIEKLPNGGYKFSDGTTLTPVYTDIQEKLANYVMANPNYMSSLSDTISKQYGKMLKRAENISNVNNSNVNIEQNVNITLPNVTNTSGYEKIAKELKQAQLDALQVAHRR